MTATDASCAACGDPIADDARAVDFDGETYCTNCTTRAECSNCGAVGTLPEAVFEDDAAAVQCGNCGDMLRASD